MRIVASILVSLLLLLAGGIATGAIGPPAVTDVENQFGTVTDETTEIETNISVHNPNPIGLTLSGTSVRYDMRANGVPLASGEKQGLAVQRGNSTVQITTLMKNERIPDWWVAHVRNGERTTMTVDATVDVGEIGQSFGGLPGAEHLDRYPRRVWDDRTASGQRQRTPHSGSGHDHRGDLGRVGSR